VKLHVIRSEDVGDGLKLTESEVDAISYLADLGSDESKIVSGWVLREFSNLSISFVIGGSFAVGDNETFGKVVDEFFQSSSRRVIEATAYGYFEAHKRGEYIDRIERLIKLIERVRNDLKPNASP